jgi:putative aldouronate transport system substrate-binding protein
MKKLLLVFTILMIVGLAAFAGGRQSSQSATGGETGPVDPFSPFLNTVTLEIGRSSNPAAKFPVGDSPENNQYTRYIKEKINIDVKTMWAAALGADYDQKVNLSIASNTIPDAMVVGDSQLRQMVKMGQIQPITKVFNEYASPMLKAIFEKSEGQAESSVTFNGEMMGIPDTNVRADSVHNMWIRKDWLDELGLQPPKTLEDLKTVLRAFVKKGKMGIAGQASGGNLYADFLSPNNNTYGLDPIFSAFEAYPGYWLEKNREAVYGSILPETKEALAELRAMYAEGLIDKELGIRKDSGESVISGQSGLFFGPWWMGYSPLPDVMTNNPEANFQAYAAPLSRDGKYKPHLGVVATRFLVIKKGYAHPEALVKMVNHLTQYEGEFDQGNLGIGHYPLRLPQAPFDECEATTIALRSYLTGQKTIEDFNADFLFRRMLKVDLEKIKTTKLEPYNQYDMKYWDYKTSRDAWMRAYSMMVGVAPLVDTPYTPVYSLTYSQTKTMESRWVDLKKLEDETFLKIILGLEPLNSFDSFVTQWKRIGGDIITQEVTEEFVRR